MKKLVCFLLTAILFLTSCTAEGAPAENNEASEISVVLPELSASLSELSGGKTYSCSDDEKNLTITLSYSTGWDDSGRHYDQYALKLMNNSAKAVSGWSAELLFDETVALVDGWGADFVVSGKSLSVKGKDGEALDVGETDELGFILKKELPAEAETEASAPENSEAVSEGSETSAEALEDVAVASTEAKPAAGSVGAVMTLVNEWESDGGFYSQYEAKLTNYSEKAVVGWNTAFDFAQSFSLSEGWNAVYVVKDTILYMKNESFNETLEAGGTVSFGFIVRFDERPPEVIKGAETLPPREEKEAPEELAVSDEAVFSGLVSQHGQLHVGEDGKLTDENNNLFQSLGVSTHGIQWHPEYVDYLCFRQLRNDWGINTIRLAMYTGSDEGYTDETKETLEALVEKGIEYCIDLDMYCIIDWHLLGDKTPATKKDDAVRFFDYISEKYGDYPNIIYEICNEPNGNTTWRGDIAPYAVSVISTIRENDPDGIIIVGTPTWSQDITEALASPLSDPNVMYSLHFYSLTHTQWLRNRLSECADEGLPIFVSEFGTCASDGRGENDFEGTDAWLSLLNDYGISYIAWALADKDETCCLLKPGASPYGEWTEDDLSEGGKWLREWFRQQSKPKT